MSNSPSGLTIRPKVNAIVGSRKLHFLLLGIAVFVVFIVLFSWSQFQPVQPQYLVVCSNAGGYLDIKDFVVPNIIVTVIWTLITWPAFYFLAPLAGLG